MHERDVKANYELTDQLLGNGSFGKVFLGYMTHDKQHKVAIKILSKKKLK
jgi:calcium-dependent protein kinase